MFQTEKYVICLQIYCNYFLIITCPHTKVQSLLNKTHHKLIPCEYQLTGNPTVALNSITGLFRDNRKSEALKCLQSPLSNYSTEKPRSKCADPVNNYSSHSFFTNWPLQTINDEQTFTVTFYFCISGHSCFHVFMLLHTRTCTFLVTHVQNIFFKVKHTGQSWNFKLRLKMRDPFFRHFFLLSVTHLSLSRHSNTWHWMFSSFS